MSLRLGFHYHVPGVQKNGELFMPGYQGRFVDSLANNCERVMCFLHSVVPGEKSLCDYCIQSQNVEWIDLGMARSAPYRTIFSSRFTRYLQSTRQNLDVLLLRGPSPLLPALASEARDLPVALLLVGDYLAGIDVLPQPRWRKEAIRLWAYWNHRGQMRVARQSLTFVNSRALYEQLSPRVPHLVETRTTTLNLSDLYERQDTCTAPPFRLLYTGRMSRTKGLLELVDALSILVSQGENAVLDLVGMREKGDNILEELPTLAETKGVAQRVIYHGYKPVGPELFSYYRHADIYVIASQSSFEGFPRTIWEAMAHSLPVVATAVGSIPLFLQDGETALIVSPRNSMELANAISSLLHSSALRKKLIRNGMRVAAANTLEQRGQEMVKEMERWVSHCSN